MAETVILFFMYSWVTQQNKITAKAILVFAHQPFIRAYSEHSRDLRFTALEKSLQGHKTMYSMCPVDTQMLISCALQSSVHTGAFFLCAITLQCTTVEVTFSACNFWTGALMCAPIEVLGQCILAPINLNGRKIKTCSFGTLFKVALK